MNEIKIKIPGFTLAGKTWGNPKNPPILALHGWLDNANSFALMAPYLQTDYYFIAIDLPGHGLSSHLPEGCNYHFFDAIFIVIELIKKLNVGKVHLLGHSMGACIASLLGGVAPELMSSIYFIEALGPFSAAGETACQQLTTYAQFLSKFHHFQSSKGYTHFESMTQARASKGYVSKKIATILCERAVVEKKGLFYWRHDKRLLANSPLRMTEEQILSCLHNITAKTHLLLSHDGFSFDPDIIEKRINAVNNLQISKLAGGHHIHMEQPETVAQLLAAFYQTL
ncbi:MAG: alpha/beta hydrolase [Legionella sp.]|uniref:alpha/beta fold hydrolase n=1 Tax=Legionella sp. TaxID=459 RepID=UPI0039E6EBD2